MAESLALISRQILGLLPDVGLVASERLIAITPVAASLREGG